MSEFDKKNINNISEDTTEEKSSSVDKRLGDLLMRGWVMMADSCPIETCRCPLMRNFDGQKYCVGCESWHFDHERPKKQRFGELVSLSGKQNIQLKNKITTEVQKLPKNLDTKFTLSSNVITSLKVKLAYLTSELNSITDLDDSLKLLNCIKVCIDDIEAARRMV